MSSGHVPQASSQLVTQSLLSEKLLQLSDNVQEPLQYMKMVFIFSQFKIFCSYFPGHSCSAVSAPTQKTDVFWTLLFAPAAELGACRALPQCSGEGATLQRREKNWVWGSPQHPDGPFRSRRSYSGAGSHDAGKCSAVSGSLFQGFDCVFLSWLVSQAHPSSFFHSKCYFNFFLVPILLEN